MQSACKQHAVALVYIYIHALPRRFYSKWPTLEDWWWWWCYLNVTWVTSSDVYNVALRCVTVISVSVCVGVSLSLSLSLSSLLQVSAANYLGRRIGSSLDVTPFKRHASAQDQREKGRGLRSVCHWEDAVVLVCLLSVVRLITSEIACYLGNTVLIVVSSV